MRAGRHVAGRVAAACSAITIAIAITAAVTPNAVAATNDAAAASAFDGCRYLLPSDVARAAGAQGAQGAAGVQRQTQGALPPEGYEAATCAYRGSTAVTPFDTNLTVFTRASLTDMGFPASEFDDDVIFVADAGTVAGPGQPGSPVAGIGDRATIVANGSIAQLFVRSGGVRLAVEGSGPLGNQTALVALARSVLERLAQDPPARSAPVAANSFKPMPVTGPFGDGRAMLEPPGYAGVGAGSFGPYEIRNGILTTDVDPVDRTPPEMQLRGFALGRGKRGLIAVLQFAAPITIETNYMGTPIAQRIGVTFRSPAGRAITVAIGPDGKGATITGDPITATPRGTAPTAYTGNIAVLIAPPSLGINNDWTATAWARVDSTGGALPGRQGLRGWQSATPPAVVSALEANHAGASAGSLAVAPAAAPGALDTKNALALPPSLQVSSIGLSGQGKNAVLDVTFAAPPKMGATIDGRQQPSYAVTVRLIPPGWQFTPMVVTVRLTPPPTSAPVSAGITDGSRTGNAPVRIDGNVLHVDIGKFTPFPSNPVTTTPQVGAHRLLTLGTFNGTWTIDPTIAPDTCICPHGAPAGFAAPAPGSGGSSGPMTERLAIHVSGDAIAITRLSTGTTAVGTIDPTSSEFVATNPHEMWSGILANGGIDATYSFGLDQYARLAPHATGTTGATFGSAAATPIELADTFIYGDLPGAASQPGDRNTPAPAPANVPCPEVRYAVIDSSGRWLGSYEGPPPFALPDPAHGWDQNQYGNNYDYGRAVSAGWQPTPCPPQNTATSAPAPGAAGAGVATLIPLAEGTPVARPANWSRAAASGVQLLQPGDVAGDWWVCADVSAQAGTTNVAYAHAAPPCVQAASLDKLPARTGATIGSASGAATERSGSGGTPAGGGGGGNGLPIAIVVVIVVAGLVAGLVVTARRRAARATDDA